LKQKVINANATNVSLSSFTLLCFLRVLETDVHLITLVFKAIFGIRRKFQKSDDEEKTTKNLRHCLILQVQGAFTSHFRKAKSELTLTVSTRVVLRPSKLDLVVIYDKPVRYSVFVLRVWKYPTPNANKQYI